jgi:hypothetical protein
MRAVKESLAAPLGQSRENLKALARASGTSRRASGWAGEKVARNRDHSRPLAIRLLPAVWGNKGRGRGCWDDFLGTVEVAITTPLLFWPLTQLGERGLSYRLTNDD